MKLKSLICFLVLSLTLSFSGCGYTARSLLPAHIKKIHIKNFKNSIDVTKQTSEANTYKAYLPRLEIDITKAIIDKFIFDGNLKVTQEADADIILVGELVNFEREPLRYDEADNVEQYRIVIAVDVKLKDVKKNKILWDFKSYAGSYEYYTSGSQAKSEGFAVVEAKDDLARRIVEQTIEMW